MSNANEKKWVQDMLQKAQKADATPKPTAKNNDVNIKEVEDLYKSIQRRLQREG